MCAIRGCPAPTSQSYHRIPRGDISDEWIRQCKPGTNRTTARVCGLHFHPSCFSQARKRSYCNGEKTFVRLLPGSIPTLFLKYPVFLIIFNSESAKHVYLLKFFFFRLYAPRKVSDMWLDTFNENFKPNIPILIFRKAVQKVS